MATKVLLVLGAGGNNGAALAKKFASGGYKVALASRSAAPGLTSEGFLNVKLDLAKSEQVAPAFDVVKEAFGSAPSVVVYNAYAGVNIKDPLAVPADVFAASLTVNITSAFVAAQATLAGRSPGQLVTFIFTGNAFSAGLIAPQMVTLGVGKSGASHLIQALAVAYKDKNALFYYADERQADGTAMWKGTTGTAHADFYFELAQRTPDAPGPTLATFVEGVGYRDFVGIVA